MARSIDHAKHMCRSGFWNGGYVVRLLREEVTSEASYARSRLLNKMSEQWWDVVKGSHVSRAGATHHVSIQVGSRRYHLRLDSSGAVFQITDKDGSLGMPPWVPSGSSS